MDFKDPSFPTDLPTARAEIKEYRAAIEAKDAEIKTAVAAERERCARVADGQAEFVAGELYEKLCHRIAAAIRT